MERVERRGAKGWGPILQGTEGWAGRLSATAGPHTDLPEMGSNFKVRKWLLNRQPACWSSLSVRACSETAVPSHHSQREGGHSLHWLSRHKCFWVRKSPGLESPPSPTARSCFQIQTFNIQRRSQELSSWYLPAFWITPAGSAVKGHLWLLQPCADVVSYLCLCRA